jgi:hypothetical protein
MEGPGVWINTRGWSGPINFRAAGVLSFFLFSMHTSFHRVPVCLSHNYPQRLRLFNQHHTVVLKTCNKILFFTSAVPSEIRRYKFTVSLLCDDQTCWNLRRERSSTTRYWRTKVFNDWHLIGCPPRVGRRFKRNQIHTIRPAGLKNFYPWNIPLFSRLLSY